MIKLKGQIVPRYLVECIEPKSRHLVKFGCDVRITGRTIQALTEGYILWMPEVTHVLKKKRQRTVKGFHFKNLTFLNYICLDETTNLFSKKQLDEINKEVGYVIQ